MDRLDAMRLFMRVADAGSFSKAAGDLGIGQPTVSRRIQDLEHRLGAELFQRTTRALNITEAGQRFYERAATILAEFDDAEAEARGLDHEPVGLLRISAANSLARQHLIAPAMRLSSECSRRQARLRLECAVEGPRRGKPAGHRHIENGSCCGGVIA